MLKKSIWIGLTLAVVGLMSASGARADEWNKKTVLTFSQPVEIPGHVLPAGTYTFQLAESMADRHVVQIFNADGSQIIATVMAVPDYRLTSTDHTVITFSEVPAGSPEAIRAWFYPGNTIGNEFVYPKARATQLARTTKAVVPAIASDMSDVQALKTAPIVAITPDERDVPVAAAIQTTPIGTSGDLALVPAHAESVTGTSGARHLPKTASDLPLIALLGLASIVGGFGLIRMGRRATASAV